MPAWQLGTLALPRPSRYSRDVVRPASQMVMHDGTPRIQYRRSGILSRVTLQWAALKYADWLALANGLAALTGPVSFEDDAGLVITVFWDGEINRPAVPAQVVLDTSIRLLETASP